MHAVLHAHDTAAVLFVENVYELLTGCALSAGGEPRRPPNSLASRRVPHFCLATTSSLVRSISDGDAARAGAILQAHRGYIGQLRQQAVEARRQGRVAGGRNSASLRADTATSKGSQIKHIQVKQAV